MTTTYCKLEAPYPEPAEGQKRIVFALDPKGDEAEESLRLQLIPGRVMNLTRTEAVNIRSLFGDIQERVVEGWGYDYYTVTISQNMPMTLMAVEDDNGEKSPKFVSMAGTPLLRYNSKLPVVVYLPEDAVLRYSIWSSGEESVAAEL